MKKTALEVSYAPLDEEEDEEIQTLQEKYQVQRNFLEISNHSRQQKKNEEQEEKITI